MFKYCYGENKYLRQDSRVRGVESKSAKFKVQKNKSHKSGRAKVQKLKSTEVKKARGSSCKLEPTEKFYFLSIKEFLDAGHRGCRIIPSPLVGEG
jgi:hypothetical protein